MALTRIVADVVVAISGTIVLVDGDDIERRSRGKSCLCTAALLGRVVGGT